MQKKRKRNILVRFFVYPEEKFLIDEKVKISGKRNMSDYLRQAACYNKVQIYDFSIIEDSNKELRKIGVNINQLVARVNSTNNVYQEDLNYLKEAVEKVWHIQKSILSKLP